MSVWAIADLHLSFAKPDRRERYAARWHDHAARVEREWRAVVGPDDLVLLPGDLSMARNHRDLQPDLAWIDRLPGTKVLAPGNHDLWWNDVEKIRAMLRTSQLAVDGDAVRACGAVICGALGAPVVPETEERTAAQLRLEERALDALDQALASASAIRQGPEPLFVLWHYPPFDQHRRAGPWVPRFERAGVDACVYGHLHAQGQWSLAVQGTIRGVDYACVAADAIGFRPLRIDRHRKYGNCGIQERPTPQDPPQGT